MAGENSTYIDQYITNSQKEVLSLKHFYDTILVSDSNDISHTFRTPIDDFFLRYRDELSTTIQWYQLPEYMYYKPKMVSKEIYGTTELWLSILRVNDMKDVTEFHLPLIKIFNPIRMKELINIFFKREGV